METGGLCRLDAYGQLQEEILRDLGYRFEFVNLAEYMGGKKREWLRLAKKLSPKLNPAKVLTGAYDGVKMAEYMDEIEALYYQNAGFEAVKEASGKFTANFCCRCRRRKTGGKSGMAIRPPNKAWKSWN